MLQHLWKSWLAFLLEFWGGGGSVPAVVEAGAGQGAQGLCPPWEQSSAAFCRISYGTCAAILLGPTPRERILEDKIFMDIFMAYFQGMDAVFPTARGYSFRSKRNSQAPTREMTPHLPTSSFWNFFWLILFRVPPWLNPLALSPNAEPVEIKHSL